MHFAGQVKIKTSFLSNLLKYMPNIKTHGQNRISMQIIWDAFDFQHKFQNWLYIHQLGPLIGPQIP